MLPFSLLSHLERPHALDARFQPPVRMHHVPATRLRTLGEDGPREWVDSYEPLGLSVVDKGQGVHL